MKKIILLTMLLSAMICEAQQEPQYTQNQFNSNLEINPAYAGANNMASASLRYRKQWAGFDGAPSTLTFNGEGKVIKDALALGLTVISDNIGITNSTSVDLSIASHLRISEKGILSAGIKAGVSMLNSDFSKLENVNPTDPLYASDKLSITYLGLGLLYHTPKFYVGFSIPRMISFGDVAPQTKVFKPHYFLYGGYRISLDDNLALRPALLVKYVEAAAVEADIAMDVWYKGLFGLGVSYRTADAVTMAVKARFSQFEFGYSYDMTTSRLRTFNTGSHEIYLGYLLGKQGTPGRIIDNTHF
ncbi:MAG: type IX secretion system membrane protein PorP/SprF [Bacteroidales bacterium]|nr:type IX secretion system membrane protein PorP/SprF [Bacteroidales bacterium]